MKPLMLKVNVGKFIFRQRNKYHQIKKMKNVNINKINFFNRGVATTATTKTFSLLNKSLNVKFLLLGTSGAGTALYFSSKLKFCTNILNHSDYVVYAAGAENNTVIHTDIDHTKENIIAEGDGHKTLGNARDDNKNDDTKEEANEAIVEPNIWSWVLEAAKKDWIFYILAAGCSIGMAVCMVLESRQFGEIYRIFSRGGDNILNETRNLIILFITEFSFSTLGSSLLAVATSRLGQNLRSMYFQSVIKQGKNDSPLLKSTLYTYIRLATCVIITSCTNTSYETSLILCVFRYGVF
jgi:hypothetical protein